jgi:hypothetical protein
MKNLYLLLALLVSNVNAQFQLKKVLEFDTVYTYTLSKPVFDGEYLYYSINGGAQNKNGQIFRIDKYGNNYSVVYTFDSLEGVPVSNMCIRNGRLYGFTDKYPDNAGLFYSINTDGTDFTSMNSPVNGDVTNLFLYDTMLYIASCTWLISPKISRMSINGNNFKVIHDLSISDGIDNNTSFFFVNDTFIYSSVFGYTVNRGALQ